MTRDLAGSIHPSLEELQQHVEKVWSRVLNLTDIPAGCGFVEMGGDSLDAVEVVTILAEKTDVDLEPSDVLLRNPTVHEMSVWISDRLHSAKPVFPKRAPADREALVASIGQSRLWRIDQSASETDRNEVTHGSQLGEYVVTISVEVEGQVDLPTLQLALNGVIARHEPLRSRFSSEGPDVFVELVANPECPLEAYPSPDRRNQAAHVTEHAINLERHPIDLRHGPLIHARLLQHAPNASTLLVAVHHIAIDAWSIPVLVEEIAAAYDSVRQHGRVELAPLPARYSDFVKFERDFLQTGDFHEQLKWWTNELRDLQPLQLPETATSTASAEYAQFQTILSPDLTCQIRDACRDSGCTSFMFLLTAFQALLGRYCGCREVLIATPMSCRHRREWDRLVGFFVNTVPIRTRFDETTTIAELLAANRLCVAEAFRRRHVPFDHIVAGLHSTSEALGNSLTQAAFALYDAFPAECHAGNIVFRNPQLRISTSRFPLELHVWDECQSFRVEAHYDESRLNRKLVPQFMNDLECMLQCFCRHASEPVLSVELPSTRLRAELPATISAVGSRSTHIRLEAIFREVAIAWPDRIAIRGKREAISYGELARFADRLASQLLDASLRPGFGVGIALLDLGDYVAALIATLEAGGFYVPVDCDWPVERRKQILRAAGCRIVVTDLADWGDEFSVIHPRNVFSSVDIEERSLAGELRRDELAKRELNVRSKSPLQKDQILPDAPAYAMFTSGSTGTPKGVLISHRAIISFITDPRYARIVPSDVIGQSSSRAFDASTFEIWGPLSQGSIIAELDRSELISAEGFLQAIERQGVTKLFVTTALFNELVQQSPSVFASLDTVLFGGERASVRRVHEVLSAKPPRHLIHVYGPTETTTFATWYEVFSTDHLDCVPIGQPISGMRCYVVDSELNLVPRGVPGELYLAGQGLAIGYLGDPAGTAERFVPDPWSREPGERMFRTGDRVREGPSGELEYIDRLDRQIKIRGFRVEPSEIEAILCSHADVRAAVVMSVPLQTSDNSGQRLHAWVQLKPENASGPGTLPTVRDHKAELRLFLQDRLPYWMIPAGFTLTESWPLGSNGKIDRQELQRSLECETVAHEGPSLPRTEVEAGICAIFANLLQAKSVGPADDFFALGGHSLLATQLVSRIRSLLGVALPIGCVFRAATPEALAREVERASQRLEEKADSELKPLPRYDGVFPASYAQQRLWFLDQLAPGGASYNIPLSSRILGRFDRAAMELAANKLIERHEVLRTTFNLRDGEVVQIVAPKRTCPFDYSDLSGVTGDLALDAARQQAVEFMQRPFDLATDCMLRIKVVRLDADDHVLLICIHHIAADGWSLDVLVRELITSYEAFRSNREPDLPPLAIQYADFAWWQRERLRGHRSAGLLKWWQSRLEGMSALSLPTDYCRPTSFSGRGRVVAKRLDRKLEQKLRALGQEENATLFMTMMAAFQLLLSRYTGQTDIAVGSPIANRNRSALEGLIGFFVNSFVMRTDLDGDPSFRDLVRRVRQTALDAYEHQDLPFEQLVDALQPVRDTSRNPLFEVTFAVQNAPFEPVNLPGWREFDFEVTSARFDLEFDVRERKTGLVLYAFYREELFERVTIERLLQHYENILADVLAHPDQPISAAQMLGAAEYHRLVIRPNETETISSSLSCLHERFEKQAQRVPDAIAVSSGTQHLTYSELNSRSNQLAAQLIETGVRIEEAVAFPADRTLDMVIFTLAILKAGAVCLPLDPQHPHARRLQMMRQACVRFYLGSPLSEPDAEFQAINAGSLLFDPVNPVTGVQVDNSAYVLFTSGTTGVPCGVVLTHEALSNFVGSVAQRLALDADDCVLQFASPGFDVIIEEFFPIWSVGGRVVLADVEELVSPASLGRLIETQGITTVEVPAAYWRDWVDHLAHSGQSLPGCLRRVLVGCEQPDVPRLQWWQRSGAELFTVFGLTETAVTSSLTRLPNLDSGQIDVPLSLGSPIANTQYFVLDRDGNPVPEGVVGELYIAGRGLARGYLNDPARTAARFIPNPFSRARGERLYRTGDLARYRHDGTIDYVGRRDQQYNLRGFRIEAEDVETALRQHPLVAQAAVTLEGSGQDARLVGYVACPHTSAEFQHIQSSVRWEHLNNWREFYDQTYVEPPVEENWNLSGWVSTFTGKPIPPEEMRVQVAQTVSRMLEDRPHSILEIGCGTGLLVRRAAPHCTRYVATDISRRALEATARAVQDLDLHSCSLQLLQLDAGDTQPLLGSTFDLVCLNSVVQHFPDVEYFVEVVQKLELLVERGGRILLGDVRLRPLAACFYAAVERFRTGSSDDVGAVMERIEQRELNEPDLLLDPDIFTAIANKISRIADVRVLPKRGHESNELCRYRCDVILQFDRPSGECEFSEWMDWRSSGFTWNRLNELLNLQTPDSLFFKNVPNARFSQDRRAWQQLRSSAGRCSTSKGTGGIADLQDRPTNDELLGLDPELLWELGERLPYFIDIRIAPDSAFELDIAITRRKDRGTTPRVHFPSPKLSSTGWVASSNCPVQRAIEAAVAGQLRSHLQGLLPQYMIPAIFVILDRLPLTQHGKIDRASLPRRQLRVRLTTTVESSPKNEIEAALLEIWSEVLRQKISHVGANFFELGGQSLLAVQVIARIRSDLNTEIPLRAIFESPTPRELAKCVSQARDAKHQVTVGTIPLVPRNLELPLSFGQERLWFLNQLEPTSCAYNILWPLRLRGPLDINGLEAALRQIVQRHEVLRTVYGVRQGRPHQVIAAHWTGRIELVDLTNLNPAEQEAAILRHAAESESRPFALTSEQPLRCQLLRCGPDNHILCLTVHHIAADGWSMDLLSRELATCYEAQRTHRTPALPLLEIQYADYAAWQRSSQNDCGQQRLAYWLQELTECTPLSLPVDFKRSGSRRHWGRAISLPIAKATYDRLKALSQSRQATPFGTCLAVFYVLLLRLTGQSDLSVGCPVANRSHQEVEPLIGFFVNSLVLRQDLSDDPTFDALLMRVREKVFKAFDHADLPFERLVAELQPDRSLVQNPLFQVVFSCEADMDATVFSGDLLIEPFAATTTISRFDLEFHVLTKDQSARVVAVYDRTLFSQDSIAAWMESYLVLLDEFCARPDNRISAATGLSAKQTDYLVNTSKQSNIEQPAAAPGPETLPAKKLCLHEMFSEQARRTPRQIAIRTHGRELTYKELENQSDRVAARLQAEGFCCEHRVALLLERSLETVVAILGVLKAGAAYVPLDPQLPAHLLRTMVQDSQASILLHDDITADIAHSIADQAMVLHVNSMKTGLIASKAKSATHLDNLAYILYTSGSTGVPKGVGISHKSVLRLVESTGRLWHIDEDDTWSLFHSFSFDFSVWELWGALLRGARVVIVPEDIRRSPEEFLKVLCSEKVSILNLTPTAFAAMLQSSAWNTYRDRLRVRTVYLSGEAVDLEAVRLWFACFGDERIAIHNVYGITETTVFVSEQRMRLADVENHWPAASIGRSLPEWQCVILDEHMNLLPRGAIGEICVGGPGLARGYWNDPGKTADRFVPNPWGDAGSRLYRSGDLGRLREDGSLEYCGRIDDQVKIRGHRVEPNEIACHLRSHPEVREALVVTNRTNPSAPELVAYVVPTGTFSHNLRLSLRRYLEGRLPRWMLPRWIVLLDELPRSAQGKINRQLLPAPKERLGAAEQRIAPRNPVEQALSEIWSDVLNLHAIGIHDDFFAIGGHSLFAAQVAAKARDALGVEIPLRLLFESPTIARLAEYVKTVVVQGGTAGTVLDQAPKNTDIPLSNAQRRLWFLQKLQPDDCSYVVPLAMRITGRLNLPALQRSVDLMVERHASLRTLFVDDEQQPLQRVLSVTSSPIRSIDLTDLSDATRKERIRQFMIHEETTGFDLTAAPPFRAQLLKCSENESILLMSFHHIICDGWSMNILQSELIACYEAFSHDDEPALLEANWQYADYAVWEAARSARCDDQLLIQWWRETLRGARSVQLPQRKDSSVRAETGVDSVHCRLSQRTVSGLEAICREHSVSRFMLLLGALYVVLARETGERDLTVGTAVANRNRSEFERVVGFFVNVLPLRCQLDRSSTFIELLAQVRTTTLEALVHQELSFERLVEQLQPQRSPAGNPFFDILYSYQCFPFEPDSNSRSMTPLGLEITTTRFDLELLVWNHEYAGENVDRDKSLRQELELSAIFRRQAFENSTIEKLLAKWVSVLDRIALHPFCSLNDLLGDLKSMTSATPARSEMQHPTTPPKTLARMPLDSSHSTRVESIFADHANRQSDKIAVRDASSAWTYSQLNFLADRLAAQLVQQGVRSETPVGILAGRSAEAIVAMLGILKAGGTYVPIATDTPRPLMLAMLRQISIKHVVGIEQYKSGIEDSVDYFVDVQNVLAQPQAASTWQVLDHPDSLAYIMFTSGSTGIPKAVGVRHQSIQRLVQDTDYVQFSAEDVVSQIADIAFDGSTFEIWGSLLNGGTLEIVDRTISLEASGLGRFFCERSVTVAFLPTALFHQLAMTEPSLFRTLRYLIVGGERLDPGIARRVLSDGPKRLVNGYGPTETTTFATSHPVNRVGENAASIPIGKPILGVDCYVLDDALQPVRPGERGELYISGTGLSRGYVNDARLSAERFLPHPFSDDPGARIYRTGDLVSLQPSGSLEILGRMDDQIKIRGHRVELGEIEAAIRTHSEVHQAVVMVHGGNTPAIPEQGKGPEPESPLEPSLTCYFVRQTNEGATRGSEEFVANWRTLYDDLYAQKRSDFEPDLNLIGWNSSFTGAPIPAAEMREQIEQSVNRIKRWNPQSILEIGCGTGLLLFRLASDCRQYFATDFSPSAVDYVKQHMASLLEHPETVDLRRQDARELGQIAERSLDTVLLNSVVQYFPSIDYLLDVFQRIAPLLKSGGHVYVGDVRSLGLLQTFHTAVLLHGADDDSTCAELRKRLEQACKKEDELLLDPHFFLSQLPFPVSDVRIELKAGRSKNELTQYRYDVVLTVGTPGDSEDIPDIKHWMTAENLGKNSLAQIEQWLNRKDLPAWGVRGLVNARIHAETIAAAKLLETADDVPVRRLREMVEEQRHHAIVVDPQDLWDLGTRYGCDTQVTPSLQNPDTFDVGFVRSADVKKGGRLGHSLFRPPVQNYSTDLRRWGNDPLAPVNARELGQRLSTYLRERLPEYMVPTHFVLLERFPLNANGKIDRHALPAPPKARINAVAGFEEPTTATERTLSSIWSDLLRLDGVGISDNFFQLGGHSLLATQVVSRIRNECGIQLPLRALFEHQTVAGLAKHIDELLEAGASKADVPIKRVQRSDSLPLSFAQQRLWFLEQLDPERCAYNMPAALKLEGPLDVAALQHALDEVIKRHESLRTSFPSRNGQPVQRVSPFNSCILNVVDLSGESADRQQKQIEHAARLEETTPFDLETGPLIRGRLLRCAVDDWVLLITMHHIISDGWSITIFTRELAEFYAAHREQRPAKVPALPVQYADFACWQRKVFEDDAYKQQLAYWSKQLAGVTTLRLPVDHPPPSRRSFRGDFIMHALAPSLCQRVEEYSRRENVTPFMMLLAAFQVLLGRWTGQTDIVVGTPIANRNRQDIEGLIGFFVNSLVMRADLTDNPPFDDLLKRVRDTALEAYAHQDLPFEQLVDELRPERTLTQNPLFQVLFAVQNATSIEFALPDLKMSIVEFDLTTTRFDLEVHVWQTPGLTVCASYDTELFEKATIERLLRQFERLLISIVAAPQQRISELALLPAIEEETLLSSWNRVVEVDNDARCLHERFEQMAQRVPGSIAVSDESSHITYYELDARSDALALQLYEQGVRRESIVALYCGRSAAAIVAMLGVLKAGAAYLPLDTQWPRERIIRILKETHAAIVVADQAVNESWGEGIELIIIDGSTPVVAGSAKSKRPAVHPDQLAYVMYTSGSSGRPKGVQVTHRNVMRLFDQVDPLFDFGQDEVWSLFHAFTFDFSVWEIWGALLHGGKLVVVPELARRSPSDCLELLQQQSITVFSQTPTAFSQLLALPNLAQSLRHLSLKYVIFGGESLDPQLLRTWFEACGDERPWLVNMYGITETTVHVTFQRMLWEHLRERTGGSPIGRRIADLQIYLLDDHMNPVPQGSIGEVYVGGAGLARGYWGDASLTASRFVPHPWGSAGARLYKTGDLARFSGTEMLEYWGRADQQIKLRGFRIEPGEIEHCVRGHPAVLDAIVTSYAPRGADLRLVAYVVRAPGVELEDEALFADLHRHARLHLPEHMLPRVYQVVPEFPRGAHGKVDRTALPVPHGTRLELSHEFIAPRTETELALAEIWREVMTLDRVGLHDNFFELGGHSLLATQVVSRIRDRFGVEMPLRSLFERPSIFDLADWLNGQVTHLPEKADDLPSVEASRRRAALKQLRHRRQSRE